MQAYNQDLFTSWYRIANGEDPDPYSRILREFGARVVFAERKPWIKPFIKQAEADRRFLRVYDGPEAAVFVLLPDPMPFAHGLTNAGLQAFGSQKVRTCCIPN